MSSAVPPSGLSLPVYDFVAANPSFGNTQGTTTLTFRQGGPEGIPVATVLLSYSGGQLVSIQRL